MAENSKIEWTTHTFNPWRGCTKVSPGCAHCYAAKNSRRNPALFGVWGPGQPRVLASEAMWKQPLKWNKAAAMYEAAAKDEHDNHRGNGFSYPAPRPRVFCASLADWLDDEVPIEWLARLMELILRTPNLDWQLLTKRPQNWRSRITEAMGCLDGPAYDMLREWIKYDKAPANVWVGTTVEDQARADERIPILLSIPAKVRFLSCEPLLSDLNLWPPVPGQQGAMTSDWTPKGLMGIHWVICGGESGGPQARPMHPDWARALRDQCKAADVSFFFKQWGDWACVSEGSILAETTAQPKPWHAMRDDDRVMGTALMRRVGKAKAGRLLDGIEHNGFPKMEGRGV